MQPPRTTRRGFDRDLIQAVAAPRIGPRTESSAVTGTIAYREGTDDGFEVYR